MYVCMHVCMCPIYLCTHIYTYVCIHLNLSYIFTYVYILQQMHVRASVMKAELLVARLQVENKERIPPVLRALLTTRSAALPALP